MISAIRSEFRKLLTIRSTYIILLLSLGLMAVFAFYVEGFRLAESATLPNKLALQVTNFTNFLSIFASIVGLLLMAHEYRYNTISYTLTAARSRLSILLAKIFVMSSFAVLFALAVFALGPALAYLGLKASGTELAPQTFPVWNLLWRSVAVMWGAAMYGLLLATLIRRQVGAIASLFIMSMTVEPLLTLLLENKAAYLPFTALGALVNDSSGGGPGVMQISDVRALLVVVSYVLIGWIAAWVLFVRRDSN